MTIKEKIKIGILAFLMVWIVVVIVTGNAYSQSSSVRYHQKLQKERSFETWKRNQPKVRIDAVKQAKKQSKSVHGDNNQVTRLQRKENRLRQGIIKP